MLEYTERQMWAAAKFGIMSSEYIEDQLENAGRHFVELIDFEAQEKRTASWKWSDLGDELDEVITIIRNRVNDMHGE